MRRYPSAPFCNAIPVTLNQYNRIKSNETNSRNLGNKQSNIQRNYVHMMTHTHVPDVLVFLAPSISLSMYVLWGILSFLLDCRFSGAKKIAQSRDTVKYLPTHMVELGIFLKIADPYCSDRMGH